QAKEAESQGGAGADVFWMLLQDTLQRGNCLVKLICIESCHAYVAVKSFEQWVPVSGFAEILQSNRKSLLTSRNYPEIIIRIRNREPHFIDVVVSLFARFRRDDDCRGSDELFLLRQVRK